jgi:glycine/D-amino acid oxidase-like deaminating enzyme
VVVVGGGLLGVSAAYHLAVAGMRPVLVEAGVPAAGASGRSAGMLVPGAAVPYPYVTSLLGHDAARDLYQRTVENVALVRDLADEERIECALTLNGILTLGIGDGQCAAGRVLAEVLALDGFEVRVVERDDLAEFVRTPTADHVGGGLFQADGGSVDPARLVAGLAEAARRHGAQLVTGTAVRLIDGRGGRIELDTSAGPVSSASAVVALNAWTPALIPELLGLITPARAQMLAYEPVEPVFHVPTTAALTEHGEYWRQTPGGEIRVGGRRDLDHDFATRDQIPTEEVQRGVEQVLPALFPQLRLPAVRARWAGAMAMTPDGLPVAGRVPGVPGAWFAAGCNGHGLALAASLGRSLAEAVATGRTPTELEPFSVVRPSLG